jgi:hypothetical protein
LIVLDLRRIRPRAVKLQILRQARFALIDYACPRTGVRAEVVRGGDELVIATCCQVMELEVRHIMETEVIGPATGPRDLSSFPGCLIDMR